LYAAQSGDGFAEGEAAPAAPSPASVGRAHAEWYRFFAHAAELEKVSCAYQTRAKPARRSLACQIA